MVKNQEFELIIDDIGNDGEGIGHFEGMAIFVKEAIPGDVIRVRIMKVKKNYAFGRMMEIIKPSQNRVEPRCPRAKQCGGCNLQHLSYEAQLEYKQNKVKNCLERIGKVENVAGIMEPILGMVGEDEPWNYRNKAQYPVGLDENGSVVTGFYASRSHTIIPWTKCNIQEPINERILTVVNNYLEEQKVAIYNEENHTGLVRHILTRVAKVTGEIMVCIVINGSEIVSSKHKRNVEEELVNRLAEIEGMTSICVNVNCDKTNKILGDSCRTLWGKDYITDYIGEVKYHISPLSFYQVNPIQTKKLYEKALEYANLSGNETVWDLYCGIGTISLFLAQRAKKVIGVEIIPEAIEDAKHNAKINGFDNAEFLVGKAEEVLPDYYSKHVGSKETAPDVIVIDPPRKGCDQIALDTMIKMSPERIVYVSCDPATLARDVKILGEAGYELQKVCPTDMFPQCGHVESVVLMSKVNTPKG